MPAHERGQRRSQRADDPARRDSRSPMPVLYSVPPESTRPGTTAAAGRTTAAAAVPVRQRDRHRASAPAGGVGRRGQQLGQASQRSGRRTPRARKSDAERRADPATSWMDRIESPPSSKKLSWTPTRSTPSTSAQIPARARSASVRGAHVVRRPSPSSTSGRAAPAGRACRWRSAAGRPASRTRRAPCSRAGRRPAWSRAARPAARRSRRRGGDHVGDQALAPGVSSRAITAASATPGCRRSDRLDLAGLDAEAADLDLVVGAAEELQLRRRAVQRTRSPVRYIREPRRRRTGRRRTAGGQPGPVQVAAGQAAPADVQLAGTPAGTGRRPRSST